MDNLDKTTGNLLTRLARGGGHGEGAGRGGIGQVVRWLGWSLIAPHKNPERVDAFFRNKHRFPRVDRLQHIARVGVPVDVLPGGDLTKRLECENHWSAEKCHEEAWEKR